MIIFRPIAQKDRDLFSYFAFDSLLGMTHFPKDPDRLESKIKLSEDSFLAKPERPGKEEYFFVLEDLITGRIGGIAGILAKNAINRSYFYKIETIPTHAQHFAAPKEMQILMPITRGFHASELCSLYLQPSFRHSGQGRLLSLSRLLFIAAFKERFAHRVCAEMRGYVDQRQIAPFWDNVGRHFCALSFVELMNQLDEDKTFISEILPKFPLYVSLLSKEAQDVLGKTHDNTRAAFEMLRQEGFVFQGEIDLFDGGPLLNAKTSSIRTVKRSLLMRAEVTSESLQDQEEWIVSNECIDFRACKTRLQCLNSKVARIHREAAEALLIHSGSWIRIIAPVAG